MYTYVYLLKLYKLHIMKPQTKYYFLFKYRINLFGKTVLRYYVYK